MTLPTSIKTRLEQVNTGLLDLEDSLAEFEDAINELAGLPDPEFVASADAACPDSLSKVWDTFQAVLLDTLAIYLDSSSDAAAIRAQVAELHGVRAGLPLWIEIELHRLGTGGVPLATNLLASLTLLDEASTSQAYLVLTDNLLAAITESCGDALKEVVDQVSKRASPRVGEHLRNFEPPQWPR